MTWEGELQALERAIAAVSVEYDAFLYGFGKTPPVQSRKNVESMLRQLGGRDAESAADRYRFSTLQGRWTSFCERWERLQLEKEAGRRPGLYGHFRPATGDEPPAAPAAAPNAEAPPSVREGGDPLVPDARRQLFEKYAAARRAHGDSGAALDFERFSDSLEREARRLREHFGGADVEFEVAERDGKVKLVAKRKS